MTKLFQSLYWKISATFVALLFILGAIYIYVVAFSAEMYFQEANQRLNARVAQRMLNYYKPLVNHQLDSVRLEEIYTIQKIFNPSIEVYVLDTLGNIVSHCPTNQHIQCESVSVEPIRKFVGLKTPEFLEGEDPKKLGIKKTFSAAKITDGEKLIGYLYVILGSEEFDSNFNLLIGSYILRIGARTTTITLIGAAVIGLIALLYITKNLRTIIRTVHEFKKGNYNARIQLSSTGELNELATSFNEMADTIVKNLEEIKTMDSLRRELVANVSHDLRTPLSTIHGYIETLMIKTESLTKDEREQYLKTVLTSTERLRKLVEELFELSKLEAKQTKPNPEPFSISELVQDIGQKYLIIAEKKGITFQCVFPKDLPMIVADIALIDRVIQNLVDNAIKFTPSGGIVRIELHRLSDGVDVKISDTGSGILPEDIPNIFDRYNKGSQKNIFQNDGAGLGLAIVKKILEVHSLTIDVDSKVNEGTAFSFTLPVHVSHPH
ncbi:MAG: HAMP domain-containing histidine kinase [Ignavibacteriales bacterium]|nr:HAMP domain-containing histidine kinase [Ignavibacteriales bacterium]